SDFFNVINSNSKRQMIIIEFGSGPAGQFSMPSLNINNKRQNGYKLVIQAFKQALKDTDFSLGELAIVCDMASDEIEATRYAATISEETKEHVWIVMLYDVAKYLNERIKLCISCFNHMAYKPCIYFSLKSKTVIFNNIIAYLAGGQNKIMVSKLFEVFNTEFSESGLAIHFSKTIYNISKYEISSYIEKMGGHAVIKAPYGYCGQGIYIITNSEELKEFFDANHHYKKFIVQSLVRSALWSKESCSEKFYHIGTMPNCHNQTFVNDLRMMVSADNTGFHPVNISLRRASEPLPTYLPNNSNWNPWKVFGTNVTSSSGMAGHEYERIITIDQK
ncbi:22976_t:CDS:2, partial [Racocetra persica]